MPRRRRRKRGSGIIPVGIAIVLGLAVATGIYWRQNPGFELEIPQGLTSQVTTQSQERGPVPDSFAAITATNTPTPPTRTPTSQPRATESAPSALEKITRVISESAEERQARKEKEAAEMITEIEQKVHIGINAARFSMHGSHQLQWDDRLGAIARAHSEDMTKRRYFSHDTPEGLGPTERAQKAGYSCRKGYSYGLAENIAIEPESRDLDRLAAAAVRGWLGSPGHRANIMDRQYDRTGIGASFGRWRGYKSVYITQVFC